MIDRTEACMEVVTEKQDFQRDRESTNMEWERQGKLVGWTAIVAIRMSSQCQICLSVIICMYMCVRCMTVYMYSIHMYLFSCSVC